MDRIAPSLRPDEKNAGTQRWRDLLFLHWQLPVSTLRPVVPPELELDLFDGRAFVGVVPFLMRAVRPSWWPGPSFNFYETNLRTYVQHRGGAPGVYFFSLEASSWLAVQAARTGWGLPYHHATMNGNANEGAVKPGDELEYRSERRSTRVHSHVRCKVGDLLPPPKDGSLEFFLLERYLLYNVRGGRLHRGQVHHVPYPAHAAGALEVSDIHAPASRGTAGRSRRPARLPRTDCRHQGAGSARLEHVEGKPRGEVVRQQREVEVAVTVEVGRHGAHKVSTSALRQRRRRE